MRLTLIRHTAVDVPKGICYGKSDVPLASTFGRESEEVRRRIGAAKFDHVYSSPRSRCTRLAAAIGAGQAMRIDDNLCELDFGDWEMADWDSVFASPDGKKWFADYVNSPCPNGESFVELIERMRSFLNALRATQYANVVACTHAGNLRAAICLLGGKSPQESFYTPVDYGQILTFSLENNESDES